MNLQKLFCQPPADFRPMPFWFWNGKLEIPRLERQIIDMHEKGLGGFFIHARFGLDTGYLSDEWITCVKASVETAARLGMHVWLYDENNFPSGISDLKASANPSFRPGFADLIEIQVSGPDSVSLHLPPGQLLTAKAVRLEAGKLTNDCIDLSSIVRTCELNWNTPPGDWLIMAFIAQTLEASNNRVFGIDYLNREATEFFLQTTHEVYARHVGNHFGKTIKGFFVDEPTLLPWHHDICWYGNRPHPRVVVWTPALEAELEKLGLPASEILPHLFYTLDETTPARRRSFYKTVNRLYVDSFFKPYRDWCDRHGLLLTGHLLLEEGLYCNTIFQSDPVPPLSLLHIPGLDNLGIAGESPYGGWAHLPKTSTNVQGVKLVSSLAHQASAPRVLSETFGCAGWQLCLQDMKRITDWQFSLGVNFMCPHAVFYSIEGFRKTDAPPSHNHNASWKYYRAYSDYAGRLATMLTCGTHVAQAGILYPLEGFQSVYEIGRESLYDSIIGQAFDAICAVLPRIHCDYDILHSSAVAQASISGKVLQIADETFPIVIVPPTPYVPPEAERKLREFASAGGCVIVFPWSDTPEANDFNNLDALGAWLQANIYKTIPPDITVETGEGVLSSIRCLHRQNQDSHIYFFVNTSDKWRNTTISLNGKRELAFCNAETGEISHIPTAEVDGRTHLEWSFPPLGSAIFVSGASEPLSQPNILQRVPQIIKLDGKWKFLREQPNCLILNRWDFRIQTAGNTDSFIYHTAFEVEVLPDSLLLLLDDIEYRNALMGGMNLTIRINEHEWQNPDFGEYLDRGFKTLDILHAVHHGQNEICLTIVHDGWTGEPKVLTSLPKLLGDFEVAGDGYTIRQCSDTIEIGSWTEHGYPYYSGTARYTTSVRLPEGIEGSIVTLILDDVADMFEAVVNGVSAGVRPWQPWQLDISRFVRSGDNEITILITNSMQNFLEGVPKPSGLLSLPTLCITPPV